jgi:hypothetical protein
MSLHDEITESDQIDELRRALNRAQAQYNRLKKSRDEMAGIVYQAAKDAALAYPRVPITPPAKAKKHRPEVALWHLTDWQLGKATTSYDSAECAHRIGRFINKATKITEIQRKDHTVDECVILFGGDMVEGIDIFGTQAFEVDSTLFAQLFAVSQILELTVRRAAMTYPTVRVVGEYGNHGRIGKFGTLPKADNFDRIAYGITQNNTKDLKNVSWQLSADWYQHVTIGNYRLLLVHGDEIRSFSGTPLFAIIKRVSAWAAGIVPAFDDCYMGHWHNPMSITIGNGGRVFVTGSPESGNTYAAEHMAAQAKPSQRLHFIDPEAGRVASEYVLWLA